METFKGSFTEGSVLYNIADFNWLTYGALFFFTCVLIAIVVSLLTKKPDVEQITGLTFGHVTEEQKKENKASFGMMDILATIAILAIIAWIMITLS